MLIPPLSQPLEALRLTAGDGHFEQSAHSGQTPQQHAGILPKTCLPSRASRARLQQQITQQRIPTAKVKASTSIPSATSGPTNIILTAAFMPPATFPRTDILPPSASTLHLLPLQ